MGDPQYDQRLLEGGSRSNFQPSRMSCVSLGSPVHKGISSFAKQHPFVLGDMATLQRLAVDRTDATDDHDRSNILMGISTGIKAAGWSGVKAQSRVRFGVSGEGRVRLFSNLVWLGVGHRIEQGGSCSSSEPKGGERELD